MSTMSTKKTFIELAAPEFPDQERLRERLVSTGHECGYCHGLGRFVNEDIMGRVNEKPCPVCQGRGAVDAIVTVKWAPSKGGKA